MVSGLCISASLYYMGEDEDTEGKYSQNILIGLNLNILTYLLIEIQDFCFLSEQSTAAMIVLPLWMG